MASKNHPILMTIIDMFLDVNGGASTKRITGFIGYIAGLILAFMHYDESTVAIVLGSAVSLIIGTAFEKKYDAQGNEVLPCSSNKSDKSTKIKYE